MNKHLLTVLVFGLSQLSCTVPSNPPATANPSNTVIDSSPANNIGQLIGKSADAGIVTPDNYEAMSSKGGSGLENSDPKKIGLSIAYDFGSQQPNSLLVEGIANDIELLLESYDIDLVFRRTHLDSDEANPVIEKVGDEEFYPYLTVRVTKLSNAEVIDIELIRGVIYSDEGGTFYAKYHSTWDRSYIRNYNVNEVGDDFVESIVKDFVVDYKRANNL